MRLRVCLPSRLFLDTKDVSKIRAEGAGGEFTLLPRHIDCVAALVPGLLLYVDGGGAERFLAVDEGLLVKIGPEVDVVTRYAVAGELGDLRLELTKLLSGVSERERAARSAVARLEAHFVRRFSDFGRP
jgi:F-type H+-transporting ATPase subunit epsilon